MEMAAVGGWVVRAGERASCAKEECKGSRMTEPSRIGDPIHDQPRCPLLSAHLY